MKAGGFQKGGVHQPGATTTGGFACGLLLAVGGFQKKPVGTGFPTDEEAKKVDWPFFLVFGD